MDMIKKVVTRKMKNISHGINNLSQQLTGRNKTPQKGTYAEVPQEEPDFETEMEAMMRNTRKKTQKTQVSLLDTEQKT
jgi:hypothetical protein